LAARKRGCKYQVAASSQSSEKAFSPAVIPENGILAVFPKNMPAQRRCFSPSFLIPSPQMPTAKPKKRTCRPKFQKPSFKMPIAGRQLQGRAAPFRVGLVLKTGFSTLFGGEILEKMNGLWIFF
jgi:hypothetical protein